MNRFFFKNTYNNTFIELENISVQGHEINYKKGLSEIPDGETIVGEVFYNPLFNHLEKVEENWYPEYNYGFDLWKRIK